MAAHDKSKEKTGKELGGSGTFLIGGIISDQDYKTELTGTSGLDIFDQMRKGDATVRVSLLAITLPILSANWFIEAASDDPKDVEIADFVKESLFEGMTITWQDFLRQALLYLPYGRMIFEIVYKMRADNLIGWQKLAPRLPHTITYWETKDHKDGIQQLLPNGKEASIPIEKLIIFVNEKEGDNWEGVSILRSAHKHWFYKEKFYKIEAIGFERQALGIPFVKKPKGAKKSADEAKAREILKNIRANEESYIEQEDGWEFGFMDMKGGTTKNPERSILHHDRQIVKNVMAQFLELGATSAGSRSLSEDHSDLFLLSLKAIANQVSDVMNKFAIKKLVDLNFNVEKYPKLKATNIDHIDVDKLSVAMQRLVQTGVIMPDAETEKYIRELMNLPEMPEGAEFDRKAPNKKEVPKEVVDEVLEMKEKVDNAIRGIESRKSSKS